jgi:hypothetical protein
MIQGIIRVLVDSTAVSSSVGDGSNGRPKIFPVTAPKDTPAPYIAVFETARVPIRCKGTKATEYTFTANVAIYGKDYPDISKIADAVENAIDSKTGEHEGITFKDIRYETRQDGFDNESELFVKIVQVAGHIQL